MSKPQTPTSPKCLLALLLCFSLTSHAQVTNGLLTHHSFNHGNALDALGNLDGTPNGVSFCTDRFGKPNAAVDFQEADARIIFGDFFDHFSMPDSSFSFSFWVYSTDAENEILISKYGNSDCVPLEHEREFFIRINPSFHIELVYYTDLWGDHYRGIEGNMTINDACWHHVVVNYRGHLDTNNGLDRVQIYVDNRRNLEAFTFHVLGNLGDIQNGSSSLGYGMSIDSEGAACGHDFQGKLDDVRIYNRTLSETEIARLYYETTPNNNIVNPISADFTLTKDSICPGEFISLLGESAYCVHNWYWTFENANFGPLNAQQVDGIQFNTSGEQAIVLVATNGYSSDTIRKTIFVRNETRPFLAVDNDTIICPNQNFLLDASVPHATYHWSNHTTDPILDIDSSGWYWVDITVAGCTLRDSMFIEYSNLKKTLSDSIFRCEGDPLLLNVAHPTATHYLWQDGSTAPIIAVRQSGTYIVDITNACETLRDSTIVIIHENPPSVQLGDNQLLCAPDSLFLDASSPDALRYRWQDGQPSAEYLVRRAGLYEVTVANACGETRGEILISSEDCCQLYIPNAFSPNEDGNNDRFQVYSADQGCEALQNFSMAIFNRWGAQIFYTENIAEGWDGRFQNQLLNSGIYIYAVHYSDGYQDYQKTGDLSLFR
ncbi:MAG: gliding motility-associated C-terminal domain-containing protein [Bacteroidota bacterium]